MKQSVLVVVAHPDDEILGCGGALKKLSLEGHRVDVLFISDGATSRSAPTADISKLLQSRRGAANKACEIIGVKSISFGDFPDNQLDTVSLLSIVKYIEFYIQEFQPSLIFTHHKGDLNIDHQLVSQAVFVASRPQNNCSVKTILACEIPSSTEWNFAGNNVFTPNWFIDITDTLERKCLALEAYKDELRLFPHSRSIEAIRSLASWRGASIGKSAAEAFMLCRHIE